VGYLYERLEPRFVEDRSIHGWAGWPSSLRLVRLVASANQQQCFPLTPNQPSHQPASSVFLSRQISPATSHPNEAQASIYVAMYHHLTNPQLPHLEAVVLWRPGAYTLI